MQNDKLCQKRLRKAKTVGVFLTYLPFVRAVILNGSLASGNHKPSSDIDILIIAKDGRIFTARFFVNFIAIIFHIKRSKDDKCGHAGKFCFNYFLTENYLHINYPKEREMYCAGNYSKSQFVAGNQTLFENFLLVNQRLFSKYGYKIRNSKSENHANSLFCHPELVSGSRKLLSGFRISSLQSGMTKRVRRFGESLFGSWFEKWVKEYQVKKIESDPRTQLYPNMIVYNDRELRFHPPKIS